MEQSSLFVLGGFRRSVAIVVLDTALFGGRVILGDLIILNVLDVVGKQSHTGRLPRASGGHQDPVDVELGLPTVTQLQLK